MSELEPIDFDVPPGLVKWAGRLSTKGRYVEADKVRFRDGRPEKIGGWARFSTDPVVGVVRGLHTWNDLTSKSVVGLGTESHLYVLDTNQAPVNVTPLVDAAGTALTDPFTTTAGSDEVTVEMTAHGLKAGQTMVVDTPIVVDGVTLDGDVAIILIVDADHFVVRGSGTAITGITGTGGAVTLYFEIAPGAVNPAAGRGWGVGGYGLGTYGTPRAGSSVILENFYWSLDNFGRLLLAVPFGGKLYSVDPNAGPIARGEPAAPSDGPGAMRGMFVTPERFVFALGASPDTTGNIDPMLVRWNHQGDLDQWTGTLTNTARSRRLQVGKKIMGGGAVAEKISMVWTDLAAYTFQYTGSQFVYDSRIAGRNCGLAGPLAFAVGTFGAFWWGLNGFFMWNGSVQNVPQSTDAHQWVRERLRSTYETKTVCFFNPIFREVWFLFVTGSSTEPDAYVAFNIDTFDHVTGTLERTSARPYEGADPRPLMAATDGYVYQHETGVDADGAALPWNLKTSVFQIASGGKDMDVFHFVPDFDRFGGDVSIRLEARDRPQSPVHDSYEALIAADDPMVDLRINGRLLTVELFGEGVGSDFRLGSPQFLVRPTGGRP